MCLLDVEEQRAGNRIFARGDRFGRRNDAVDGRNLQLVGVVFIEGQAEDADAVLVGSDASERFGVVAVDVDSQAVLTDCDALRLAASFSSATRPLMTSVAPASLQPAARIFSSKTSRVPCFSPGM